MNSVAEPSETLREQAERRNWIVLAIHQMIVRVGWIFKTEAVIMPAFFDLVVNESWARSCLPALNRFGQSLPPVWYASRLESRQRKSPELVIWTCAMGLIFLMFALVWAIYGAAANPSSSVEKAPPSEFVNSLEEGASSPRPEGARPLAIGFLALYFVFFACNGIGQLTLGTLQGKLIRPTLRGRLMGVSTFFGAILAIAFATWLLWDWLASPHGGFVKIFAFTGVAFVAAGLVVLAAREPADRIALRERSSSSSWREAYNVLARDHEFRRLALVVMMASGMQLLFPHYQAYARSRLQLDNTDLAPWVIAQNAATGLGGILLGPLADRWGNRSSLGATLFFSSLAPLCAIALASWNREWGSQVFWLVFVPVGLSPLVVKSMTNYTLELTTSEEHPRYLSTLSLCFAIPYVASPFVGSLIDVTSFELVFTTFGLLILAASIMTFTLVEPRQRQRVSRPK